MKKHSEQFLKQRKFLVALPVLALPFLSILFWALGGGQGAEIQAMPLSNIGLNFKLPSAHFEEDGLQDKLSLYDRAQQDSAKFNEARESDPYFDLISFEQLKGKESDTALQSNLIDSFRHKDRMSTDENEEKVNRKLDELYRQIGQNSNTSESLKAPTIKGESVDLQFSEDVTRLEHLMEQMHQTRQTDPEMQEISGMLEKILDIQHPERVNERMQDLAQAEKKEPVTIQTTKNDESITLMTANQIVEKTDDSVRAITYEYAGKPNGFFGLDDSTIPSTQQNDAIQAVIHDTQELVDGSTVKLRIVSEVSINGQTLPKDQIVFGTCSIQGERLTIKVATVRIGNAIVPAGLSAYDLDGLEGIHIPGAIARDQAKQSGANSLQNMQLMSMNQSLSGQMANAGVEAAKGLFTKKAKLVKVTVKAEYKILLQQGS